eukprot:m.295420 g.295420  ORF g.295420 m.295420 type:complete len:1032 (+) comp16261_c0_seq2:209-3304(+)
MEGDGATERNASVDLGGQDKEEEAARGGAMDWREQGAPTPLNTTADPPPFDYPDGGIGSVSFGLEDSTLDSSNDCQDGADKEKSGESAEVEAVAMAGAVHGNPAHAITEPLVPPCPPVEMDTDASAPAVPDSLPPATPLARSNVWVPLDRDDELVMNPGVATPASAPPPPPTYTPTSPTRRRSVNEAGKSKRSVATGPWSSSKNSRIEAAAAFVGATGGSAPPLRSAGTAQAGEAAPQVESSPMDDAGEVAPQEEPNPMDTDTPQAGEAAAQEVPNPMGNFLCGQAGAAAPPGAAEEHEGICSALVGRGEVGGPSIIKRWAVIFAAAPRQLRSTLGEWLEECDTAMFLRLHAAAERTILRRAVRPINSAFNQVGDRLRTSPNAFIAPTQLSGKFKKLSFSIRRGGVWVRMLTNDPPFETCIRLEFQQLLVEQSIVLSSVLDEFLSAQFYSDLLVLMTAVNEGTEDAAVEEMLANAAAMNVELGTPHTPVSGRNMGHRSPEAGPAAAPAPAPIPDPRAAASVREKYALVFVKHPLHRCRPIAVTERDRTDMSIRQLAELALGQNILTHGDRLVPRSIPVELLNRGQFVAQCDGEGGALAGHVEITVLLEGGAEAAALDTAETPPFGPDCEDGGGPADQRDPFTDPRACESNIGAVDDTDTNPVGPGVDYCKATPGGLKGMDSDTTLGTPLAIASSTPRLSDVANLKAHKAAMGVLDLQLTHSEATQPEFLVDRLLSGALTASDTHSAAASVQPPAGPRQSRVAPALRTGEAGQRSQIKVAEAKERRTALHTITNGAETPQSNRLDSSLVKRTQASGSSRKPLVRLGATTPTRPDSPRPRSKQKPFQVYQEDGAQPTEAKPRRTPKKKSASSTAAMVATRKPENKATMLSNSNRPKSQAYPQPRVATADMLPPTRGATAEGRSSSVRRSPPTSGAPEKGDMQEPGGEIAPLTTTKPRAWWPIRLLQFFAYVVLMLMLWPLTLCYWLGLGRFLGFGKQKEEADQLDKSLSKHLDAALRVPSRRRADGERVTTAT